MQLIEGQKMYLFVQIIQNKWQKENKEHTAYTSFYVQSKLKNWHIIFAPVWLKI